MVAEVDLSVIVPVYNGEAYLRECLESLAVQEGGRAEFICVDDGSTDATPQILQEFAQHDERFRIISKPNSGYGHSMNVGLDKAQGEYVGILESDDWIASGTLETLLGRARSHGNPEIVKANHYVFDERTGEERFLENYPAEVCGRRIELPGPEYAQLVLSVPAIWAAIYRRDFLQTSGVRFRESPGASYQDTGFAFKAWAAAGSVYVDHCGFLLYRFGNAGSSTVSKDKVNCVLEEWDSIDAFTDTLPHSDRRLLQALAAKKYQTFNWNLRRIAPEHVEAFVASARTSLARDRGRGLHERTLFTEGQWARLGKWLDDPDALVLDLRIRNASNPASRLALRVKRRVRAMKTHW